MESHPVNDYVEHVRLTNLSVLLLCLGMVIALRDPFIQSVRTELERVEEIEKYCTKHEEQYASKHLSVFNKLVGGKILDPPEVFKGGQRKELVRDRTHYQFQDAS